jgi:hypothetical protein
MKEAYYENNQLAIGVQGSPKVALFSVRHEKKQAPALRHRYKKTGGSTICTPRLPVNF